MSRLVNHQLVAETKRGQMFEIKPGPTYRDAREVCKPQLKEWASVIEHVADLFLRLPRIMDAEIAAAVHFAAKELAGNRRERPSEIDVFNAVKEWKQRRRPPLDDRDVATAIRNLNLIGWVDLAASRELVVAGDESVYA